MEKAIKQVENGVDVFIIVTEQPEVISPSKSALGEAASVSDQLSKKISDGMNPLLNTIISTCNKVEAQITEMNKQKGEKSSISELTLEFGLSLTAEAGVVFTKASGVPSNPAPFPRQFQQTDSLSPRGCLKPNHFSKTFKII